MKYRNLTIALLAALAAFRLLYVGFTPLDVSPDEAHYWEWSRRLGLSYYSKGPAVAYVIAFFTGIFGDNPFGIRFGAVVFSACAGWLMYLLGKEFFGSEKAGFYSALLPNVTPIFSLGSVLMTTDIMLVFFWAGAVLSVKKAVDTGRSAWWYATGIMVGLGFLSKYIMVLLYPGVLLFLLFSKNHRHWLKRPAPYAGALISLALATPVILWNIVHGQVTIRHTMGQAHVGSAAISFTQPIEFALSQAGFLTPFIFAGIVYAIYRCAAAGFREKRGELLLILFTTAPLFLFFFIKAFHGKVQANWAVASYVAAFPALVWAYGSLYKDARRARLLNSLAAFAIALGAALSAIVYFPWALEYAGAKKIMWGPPYNRVTGWEALGEKVSAVKKEMAAQGEPFIFSDTYQITSELALYTEGNPVTYNINTGSRRMNQYDLWPGFEGFTGRNAVYVSGGNSGAETVNGLFERCDKELFTIYRNAQSLKEFSIFRCYGFKGMEKATIEKF